MSYKRMWFGTQHHAQWVKMPLRGADMSPQSWGADGTYLSGGGFVRQSADSHRQYIFEYGGASTREDASIMQAYRDGVYSLSHHDLMYFIDPLIYDQNILPKRWAQPGVLAPQTGTVLTPLGAVAKVSTPQTDNLPLMGATITSPITTSGAFSSITSPQQGTLYVPLPDGSTMNLKVWGTGDSANGVFVRQQASDGTWSASSRIASTLAVSSKRGVLLGTVGTFDLYGIRATIDSPLSGWTVGLGHSGCRFVGNPTWIANSGVNGGQIGYATTLKEVGDWQQ